MGNNLCTCASLPKKKQRKSRNKDAVGVKYEYTKPHADVNRTKCVSPYEYQYTDSEYARENVTNSLTRPANDPIDLPESKHGSIKRQLSFSSARRASDFDEQSVRSLKRQQKSSSLKRQPSIGSGRRSPESGSRHGSLKRQLNINIKKRTIDSNDMKFSNGYDSIKRQKSLPRRRVPEPPRLVMWGLYEPKCPSKDWSIRVQQERVTAMEHGRAIWQGDTSLPSYLRRYFRGNSRLSDPPRNLHMSSSNATENINPQDRHLSESAISPKTIQCAHTTPNVSLESQSVTRPPPTSDDSVCDRTVSPRPAVLSESNSAFRSLPSYKSSTLPSITCVGRYQSRYTIKDPRSPLQRKADLIPFHMTDNWTQYDNPFDREVPKRTVSVPGGNSYEALEESLNVLKSAVEELDSLSSKVSISKYVSTDFTDANFYENSKIVENPIFVPKVPNIRIETPETEQLVSKSMDVIDLNSNVNFLFPVKENIQRVESDSDVFLRSEISEESILPKTSPLSHTIQISDSVETMTRSEMSLPISDGASPDPTSDRKPKRTGSSSTYEKDGIIHYRIRVIASPKNISLFRNSAIPSDSNTKSLMDIARESQCQLHLLPRKDYAAGVAKRTLLIRSSKRRHIKSCLTEISEHFPSLITIR